MRAGGRARLCHRDRPRRLAGARGRRAVPRGAPHHRRGGEAGRAARAWRSTQLPLADLQAIDARIDERVFAALSVEASVAARASHGGTAPAEVRKRVAEAREALGHGAMRMRRCSLVVAAASRSPPAARRRELEPARRASRCRPRPTAASRARRPRQLLEPAAAGRARAQRRAAHALRGARGRSVRPAARIGCAAA